MQQPKHERVARDWFFRAGEDWHDAQILAEEQPDSPNVIWLVQQSVEKAIKALLLSEGIAFPKMHDLERLRDLLPAKYHLKRVPKDLSLLSQRAMESRYPGEYDPVDEKEVRQALRLGAKVSEWLDKEFDQYIRHGIDPASGEEYED